MLMWFLLSFVLLFSFFLLFAIRRWLRSHFKNSCFVFYRCFQTPENNKSLLPRGLGLSSVFSCVETPVKHLHSLFKYYVINFSIRSFCFQRCCEDNVDAIINNVDIVVFWFILFRFVFCLIFSFVEEILQMDLTDENCHMIIICNIINNLIWNVREAVRN